MTANLNALKQPEPNIVSNNPSETKRETARPYVGVVDVPNISKTPIADVIELKKQEQPHTVYKLSEKPKGNLKLNTICSVGVILGSLISLISLVKKKKVKSK